MVKVHKQGKKLAVVLSPEQLAQICFRMSESIDLRDRILVHQILEAMKDMNKKEEPEEVEEHEKG